MAANSVVQALRVLQEAGREDLIKEGVLEQAWVGLKRPKRSSAERVSAAVLACTSPESPKKFRKFKEKSVAGRKVSVSPERSEGLEQGLTNFPCVSGVRGGGAHLIRRTGSSLRQCMAALGRGSSIGMAARVGRGKAASMGVVRVPCATSAVPSGSQMAACGASARATKCERAPRKATKQARLALESGGEHSEGLFAERPLGEAAKMTAPSGMAVCGSLEPDNPNLGVGQGVGGKFFRIGYYHF
ncbi:hypothetical protein NDU88_000196 [Pleurodeles waltl]|uniref:Uncharacterized protein n=1 Tax=Pleurodeles waltl TaxID=8319 RepID=A0AAV7UTC9_PLEWA|nr:hypothetical protein NDU88_000196 [Pleurodeles waltl]